LLDGLPFANRRLDRNPPSVAGSSSLGRHKNATPVVVIMDGSSRACRALQIALQLSQHLATELIVFLAPLPGMAFDELRDQTNKIINEQPKPKTLHIEVLSSIESIQGKLKMGKRRDKAQQYAHPISSICAR
jgi:hypothetical protein